jgi:hypothetical protein
VITLEQFLFVPEMEMAILLRNTTMEAARERYSSPWVATFFVEAPRLHGIHQHPMPEYRLLPYVDARGVLRVPRISHGD